MHRTYDYIIILILYIYFTQPITAPTTNNGDVMESNMQKKLFLGAHMSITGGIDRSLEAAASIGCTALQIFTSSNRSWTTKSLTDEDIERVTIKQKEYNLPIVSHCSYLINLASPSKSVQKNAYKSLVQELKRCHQLGIQYTVLHPGSRLDSPEDKALQQVATLLDEAFLETNNDVMILLETMAGQGTSIGGTFEQLGYLRNLIQQKKSVGICADTCHLFAQGYDLRTSENYEKVWENFDKEIGIKHLKVIHLNDSKKDLGSHVDRHEHIGKGKIGIEGFRMLMNDPRFESTIKILETPKSSLNDDLINLTTLKRLIK